MLRAPATQILLTLEDVNMALERIEEQAVENGLGIDPHCRQNQHRQHYQHEHHEYYQYYHDNNRLSEYQQSNPLDRPRYQARPPPSQYQSQVSQDVRRWREVSQNRDDYISPPTVNTFSRRRLEGYQQAYPQEQSVQQGDRDGRRHINGYGYGNMNGNGGVFRQPMNRDEQRPAALSRRDWSINHNTRMYRTRSSFSAPLNVHALPFVPRMNTIIPTDQGRGRARVELEGEFEPDLDVEPDFEGGFDSVVDDLSHGLESILTVLDEHNTPVQAQNQYSQGPSSSITEIQTPDIDASDLLAQPTSQPSSSSLPSASSPSVAQPPMISPRTSSRRFMYNQWRPTHGR